MMDKEIAQARTVDEVVAVLHKYGWDMDSTDSRGVNDKALGT